MFGLPFGFGSGDRRLRRITRRVARSELFDADAYLDAYPDARASGLEPSRHYAAIGGAELRNPCANIVSRNLLRVFPTFWPGRDNPVLFLEDRDFREADALQGILNSDTIRVEDLLENLAPNENSGSSEAIPSVDIVVPVYGNPGKLALLLRSLERYTHKKHTIILIDDASPDPDVSPMLAAFASNRANTLHLTNEANIGFAATVNRGLRNSGNHKIILNSDTIVPTGWVDALIAPLLRHRNAATTTPFSNASSFTGFPENRIELPLGDPSQVDRLNHAVSLFRPRDAEILCGVGFCMGINADALEQLGGFDDDAFPQGYFEDTEWCYRARQAGFRNLLVNKLFVGHDHASTSFGWDRKNQAHEHGVRMMKRKFPAYFEEMDAFYLADPHRALRRQSALVAAFRLSRERSMVIEQDSGAYSKERIHCQPGSERSLLRVFKAGAKSQATAHTACFGTFHLSGSYEDMLKFADILEIERTGTGDTAFQYGPPGQEHREPPVIAVIGTFGIEEQPRSVARFVERCTPIDGSHRLIVFGEAPDDWTQNADVSKTGVYRPDNIEALLRAYGASVVYSPETAGEWFHCVRLEVLRSGTPLLTHDKGANSELIEVHPDWNVMPDRTPEAVLDALLSLHTRSTAEHSS